MSANTNQEEKVERKIELQKFVSPKASKFFLIKFTVYALLLIGLIWLVFSRFEKIIEQQKIKPQDGEINIQIEQNQY
jgi:hypothetical protein